MSKNSYHSKTVFRIGLILLLTVLVVVPVWATPGDGEPGEEGEKRVERIIISPDIQIRGVRPNIQWVGKNGGFLGIGLTDLTPALREHFGVGSDSGVMVSEVEEGSPAAVAGLRVGDIITRAGETEIQGTGQLASLVFKQEKGSLLDVEYWRDGRLEQTSATIEQRERPQGSIFHLEGLEELGRLEELGGFEGLEQLKRLENLQPEIMERVQMSLEEAFEGDWQERLEEQLEQIQEINVEAIEERMEELRERMEELEERLEKRYGEGGSGNSV